MKYLILLIGIVTALLLPVTHACARVSVSAAVDRQQVTLGDAVVYSITVSGVEYLDEPQLDFGSAWRARYLGGQTSSRSSVTVINGKMTRTDHKSYVLSYRLRPTAVGKLTVPSVSLEVVGAMFKTQPLAVMVTKPRKSDDFILEMQISDSTAYVGQVLVLTLKWFIGKDASHIDAVVPLLEDSRFQVVDFPIADAVSGAARIVEIPVNGTSTPVLRAYDTRKGKKFTVVTLKKILIPVEKAKFKVPKSTVACNAKVSSSSGRRGRFTDPFMDSFFGRGRSRRARSERIVTSSNDFSLSVRELPRKGKPDEFTGLVGSFSLDVQASPTTTRVGAPIALTIRVAGPPYLKQVKAQYLDLNNSLVGDFKVPQEMSPGVSKGGVLHFTQTIRAMREAVTEIPPLSFTYFDPNKRKYLRAESLAIPLTIEGGKVISIEDAQGNERVTLQPEQELPQLQDKGIQHSISLEEVLAYKGTHQLRWSSPVMLMILLLPPLLFSMLQVGLIGSPVRD